MATAEEPKVPLEEDICKVCGAYIGWGIKILHLELCDECHRKGLGSDEKVPA